MPVTVLLQSTVTIIDDIVTVKKNVRVLGLG